MNKIVKLLTLGLLVLGLSNFASGQNEIEIWKEFVSALMNDQITIEKIRPAMDSWKETMLGWLKQIKENYKSLEELEEEPEAFRVDNKIHFIVTLTRGESSRDMIFTFIIEGDEWYFHLLEGMFIRFDKMSPLPVTKFPDMPEDWKLTRREEVKISKQVRLFNFLSEEKGRDFALDWFKDGAAFFLGAQARIPFFKPSKAFILYLCWEQANDIGNDVKLIKLEENEAIVEIGSLYFGLYKATAHLKDQISFENYKKIFESMWYDRAEKAGWNLEISYKDKDCLKCTFKFSRN